jgi:hypothetical protein
VLLTRADAHPDNQIGAVESEYSDEVSAAIYPAIYGSLR